MINQNQKNIPLKPSTYIVDLVNFPSNALWLWPSGKELFEGRELTAPLRMKGSTLGFGDDDDVWVEIVDSTKLIVITKTVQPILYLIDHFIERDRTSLLAAAAIHYGRNPYALMGRPALEWYTSVLPEWGKSEFWLKHPSPISEV